MVGQCHVRKVRSPLIAGRERELLLVFTCAESDPKTSENGCPMCRA